MENINPFQILNVPVITDGYQGHRDLLIDPPRPAASRIKKQGTADGRLTISVGVPAYHQIISGQVIWKSQYTFLVWEVLLHKTKYTWRSKT